MTVETTFHSSPDAKIIAGSGYGSFLILAMNDGNKSVIHMTVEQARKLVSDLDAHLAIHDATEAAKAQVKASREAA